VLKRITSVFLFLSSQAIADVEREPWYTRDFGGADVRTGAMSCTNDYPSVSCMFVQCGSSSDRANVVLGFTDLGMQRDLKEDPAGPSKTKVTLRFPNGKAFTLPARRKLQKGAGYNIVLVPNWNDKVVFDQFRNLDDKDTRGLITATLPDGRETKFSVRRIKFAISQTPRLCAR